ncbi:Alpha-1,3-arabinosyltransferase XAT3 [Sesamum angolense]|uniref:Alpha-1,3-arabinosyltransferase XAT3 n=1 Tax=Sesamum angolense TaxID=2727404 RepID=A0AAE1VXE9_9LAMI|nr:Alpha-1,3-arabinosyltransferase XAT3 [Sesamum angolense]
MHHFKQLLRRAYSLERKRAVRSKKGDGTKKPRHDHIQEPNTSHNKRRPRLEVGKKAGIRGGLGRGSSVYQRDKIRTNGKFLRRADGSTRAGLQTWDPAAGMNIRYLEYKVSVKESSLSQQYPTDHPVLKDPKSYRRRGWMHFRLFTWTNRM